MDFWSIFVGVFVSGIVVVVIATIVMLKRHEARAEPLRNAYSSAKSSNEPDRIMRTARALLEEFRQSNPKSLAGVAEQIYSDALGLLGSAPQLKPFALEMGRVAYGSKREDKQPTVYDEQAIQNDIHAHL